jgi:hypothetical protein
VPTHFLSGFLVGLAAPIAGLAAMAGVIYLVTGKVPFLSHTWPEDGDDRHLSLKLMPPGDARAAFERERARIQGDLNKMSTEIQAMAEQAQARAKASVPKKP